MTVVHLTFNNGRIQFSQNNSKIFLLIGIFLLFKKIQSKNSEPRYHIHSYFINFLRFNNYIAGMKFEYNKFLNIMMMTTITMMIDTLTWVYYVLGLDLSLQCILASLMLKSMSSLMDKFTTSISPTLQMQKLTKRDITWHVQHKNIKYQRHYFSIDSLTCNK